MFFFLTALLHLDPPPTTTVIPHTQRQGLSRCSRRPLWHRRQSRRPVLYRRRHPPPPIRTRSRPRACSKLVSRVSFAALPCQACLTSVEIFLKRNPRIQIPTCYAESWTTVSWLRKTAPWAWHHRRTCAPRCTSTNTITRTCISIRRRFYHHRVRPHCIPVSW